MDDKTDSTKELIAELEERLGNEDFAHEIDEVEWTRPEYHHQN